MTKDFVKSLERSISNICNRPTSIILFYHKRSGTTKTVSKVGTIGFSCGLEGTRASVLKHHIVEPLLTNQKKGKRRGLLDSHNFLW